MRSYDSFLRALASSARVQIFGYDIRGTGQSLLPVAQAYSQGPTRIGHQLAQDLTQLFGRLKEATERPTGASSPRADWIFMGHSLGTWLSLVAAASHDVRRVVLLDPPLLPWAPAARWALSCSLGRRDRHPLSQVVRRRKRIFRNAEQAQWVYSKFEFFHGWPKARIADYVTANYELTDDGLFLRHNPDWEGDVVESQPSSSIVAMWRLARTFRRSAQVLAVFGADSPFCAPTTASLLRQTFVNPVIQTVDGAGHMLVFQQEQRVIDVLAAALAGPHSHDSTGAGLFKIA